MNFTALEQLFINENQIKAIERNFFDNFPNLNRLNAAGNSCIDENFERISNMSEVVRKFERCFVNWELLDMTTTESTTVTITSTISTSESTTSTTSTTTEETTTLGGSKIGSSMVVSMIFTAVLILM